jgi:hypothetical protein
MTPRKEDVSGLMSHWYRGSLYGCFVLKGGKATKYFSLEKPSDSRSLWWRLHYTSR